MSTSGATQDVDKSNSSDTTPQKKSTLDCLSREDLLSKCKTLLVISQKAKQSKDDALEEVKQTKQELNKSIQESEKLRVENEKLVSRVKSIAEEKQVVLMDIESINANNLELKNLVRSISTERDTFCKDVERLNAEKQKLIKVVDMMGGENDSNVSEIRSLKEDKRKLNNELDSAMSEREKIDQEIKDVKLKLVHLLNNSFALLNSLNIEVNQIEVTPVESDKVVTGVICDLISKCDKHISLAVDSLSKTSGERSATELPEKESKVCQTSVVEIDKTALNNITKELDSQIDALKNALADLTPRLEVSEEENKTLKNELNELRSQWEESQSLLSDTSKHETELMNELEKSRSVASEKTKEVGHLKDEISALMDRNKKQSFNAMEMKGVRNENEKFKGVIAEMERKVNSLKTSIEDMEITNRKLAAQVESLESALQGKVEDLGRCKEENEDFKKRIGEESARNEALQRDLLNSENAAKENNEKYYLDIERFKNEVANMRKCVEDKEGDLLSMQSKSLETKTNASKHSSELETLQSDLSKLQTLIGDRENVISTMQEEAEKYRAEVEELTSFKLLIKEKDILIETLQKEVEKNHAEIGDLSTVKSLLEKHESVIATMKQEAEKYCADIDELSNLKKIVEEKENANTMMQSDAEKYRTDIVELKKLLVDKENLILTLQKESDGYRADIDELSNLKTLVDEKENIIAAKQKEIEKYCADNTELSNFRTLIEDKENVIAKMQKEAEGFCTDLDNLKLLIEEKETLIAKLQKDAEKNLSDEEELSNMKTLIAEKENIIVELQNETEGYSAEIKILKNDVSNLHKTIEIKELELSKVENERESVATGMLNLQKMLEEREQEVVKLASKTADTESVAAKYTLDIEKSRAEIQRLAELVETKEGELRDAVERSNTIEAENAANILRVRSFGEQISTLHNDIVDMTASLKERDRLSDMRCSELEFLRVELQRVEKESTEQLREADERYNAKREDLSDELVNLRNTSSETEVALRQVRDELESLRAAQSDAVAAKRENTELLGEMNEMNQVLKQRGESISKLKELNNDLEQKLKASCVELETKENEAKALNAELATLAEAVKEHEKSAEECGRLRTRLQQLEREMRDHGETASEAMSCSTLGRAEETSRLRDVEDSFEDRYTKLRVIAVRLKKRNSELSAQVNSLDAEKTKLTAELQAKTSQLLSNAKNVHSIQQEYDKLQDLYDSASTELKGSRKLLEAAVNDAASAKICLEELKQQQAATSKEVESQNKAKAALETRLKETNKEMQALRAEKTEQEKQNKLLTDEVKRAEARLQEESTKHRRTSEQLQSKQQEAKKNNVRCLEINDYEKTVNDLTQQLAAEKSKVVEVGGHLNNQREITNGLYEQIKLLEEALASEESRSTEMAEQLGVLRNRLSENAVSSGERGAEIARLKTDVEAHREESERAALQLAQLAADKQKLEEGNRLRVDALTQQVRALEDSLKSVTNQLSDRTKELSDIRTEFESYKVRAQSVLRQNQKVKPDDSASSNAECVEEISQLRHTADVSRTKLEEAITKLDAANCELSSLQHDRDALLVKCRELSDKVAHLQAANQQLVDKGRESAAQLRDAASKQKIHYDIVVQNYKTQLEELEERLTSDNVILRDQIEKCEMKLRAAGTEGGKQRSGGGAEEGRNWSGGGSAFVPVRRSPEALMMQEREEGEGSESVDSLSPHLKDRHELMPLDRLLAFDSEEVEPERSPPSPRADLSRLRDRLSVSDAQVRHLSALLSEAEQDLARRNQLNDVLKEEIRRNQRSDERELHAHNQEYLKNVVFKFVTLQGGDERSRLVPVLNTILKLSPEETNHLTVVAKGATESGGKGWGSYLWQ